MSVSRTETCQVGELATCYHCLAVNESSHSLVSGHVALFPSSIWFLASLMFIVGMFFIIIVVRVRNLLAIKIHAFFFSLDLGHICVYHVRTFADVRVLLRAAKTSEGTSSQRAGAETSKSQVQEG